MKCFTFTMDDLHNMKELVSEYVKHHFEWKRYQKIDDIPIQVTVKAQSKYDKVFLNPDAVLTFNAHSNGVYDIHFAEANMVLMNDAEGFLKPFDFQIVLRRGENKIVPLNGATNYAVTYCSSNEGREFLDADFKFGDRNKHSQVFILACQCSQIMLAMFESLFTVRTVGEREIYSFIPNYIELGRKIIMNRFAEERKKTITDGWDVVNLTEKQYYKVVDTLTSNHYEFDTQNTPLPKFCLFIYNGESSSYYFFERKGNQIKIGVTDEAYEIGYFRANINGKLRDTIDVSMEEDESNTVLFKWLHGKIGDQDGEAWEWLVNVFFVINSFMLHFGDVTMEVEKKYATAPSNGKTQNGNRPNTVRLFKSYKLIKGWKGQARKKAEITCLAWGVRGHFRHYRNGKTVFIEAYVKGKDREQYKGKEYALLPYKEA